MLKTDKKESKWIFAFPENGITSQGFCKYKKTMLVNIIVKNQQS